MRPPREALRHVLGLIEAEQPPGLAVDLGCGAGVETIELLARGWSVIAVDQEADALTQLSDLLARDPRFAASSDALSRGLARLSTRACPFGALQIPACDLVWAGLSLPFCPREEFVPLWTRTLEALNPGGRIAADFFGERHAWRDRPGIQVHRAGEVRALCRPLTLEWFSEGEGLRRSALEGIVHWHEIQLIARKTGG
jgi:SAM-dependent methyltransferase